MTPPSVYLGWGLGADSTAVFLRWLLEPTSRPFDLSELCVMTAMTGDEWPVTGHLVRRHILPLMAQHGVRYVQIARRGPSQTDGVAVLDDSTRPTELYLDGAYKLSDEMLTAGTVPQSGGARLCSEKAKGWPQDVTRARMSGDHPYRHAIGYELNSCCGFVTCPLSALLVKVLQLRSASEGRGAAVPAILRRW